MPTLWKTGPGRAKPAPKSIRGTISAPIPIPSTIDDDEFPIRNPGSARALASPEDEFPIRKPGTGIASPIPPAELESDGTPPAQLEEPQQTREGDPLEPPEPPQVQQGHEHEDTEPELDARPEPPSDPPPDPPTAIAEPDERPVSPRKSSPQRTSPQKLGPFRSRTSPSTARTTNPPLSTARYSVVSEAQSGHTGHSKDAPQRKKSTLRTALGRLFGRTKKRNGGGSRDTSTASTRESGFMGSSQHRSDPTALGRMNEKSPKRSTSLPLTEYDRPLRSHSIGPDDIMTIESVRNSLQADASGASTTGSPAARRRAATTTSRLLFQSRMRNPEWGAGLSPRPASTHGRGSRATAQGDFEDPSEIGRAITSDNDNAMRRRSRSLSGLQDLAVARPEARRRSDEIRFWRESYDPGFMSPLSSNAPEDAEADNAAIPAVRAPESPFVQRPPRTPPQPFNFGNIPNTMVGMKITQVVSVETRIGDLESRANRLEGVVDQLCRAVPGFKPPPAEAKSHDAFSSVLDDPAASAYTTAPPLVAPPIPTTSSLDPRGTPRYASSRRSIETTDSRSQISFGEAPTFIGSLHPPSSTAAYSQSLTATAHPIINPLHRPTSNSTVRVAASLPTLGREGSVGEDPHASLVAQLEAERAARQALEAQVKKLSERLNTLSSTMFAMVRAPSESRSQERLGGRNSPPLQSLKSIPVPTSAVALKPPSRFETDDEDDTFVSDKPAAQAQTGREELAEDVFMTPQEEAPQHVFGAFGEELRPDDDDDEVHDNEHKRKKAARTLSLSQLTLAKSQRTQI